MAGFGLLFLGLAFLKSSFGEISPGFARVAIDTVGLQGVIYSLLLGAVMTAIMQSSSAAIAIVISAHAQGMVGDTIGASLIIGANIGTTVTALIASIGATASAKRLALMHVVFNVQTALVAVALLVPLLWLLELIRALLGLSADSAVTLAVFHTVFNVIGVLLMWPLARPLSIWVNRRFLTREASVTQPKFLDESALSIPEVGVQAAVRETERASSMLVRAIAALLHGAPALEVKARLADAQSLLDRIDEFLSRLSGARMAADTSGIVADLLGVLVRFRSTLRMSDDWVAAAETLEDLKLIPPASMATLDAMLEASDPESSRFDPQTSRSHAKEFKTQRRAQREVLLEQAAQGTISIRDATRTLPFLVELGELTSELSKATFGLASAKSWKLAEPEPLSIAGDGDAPGSVAGP